MPRATRQIREDELPIAGFVAGRMKLTCPGKMKQADYTNMLIAQGLEIHATTPQMKLRVFKTSISIVKSSKEIVALANDAMPKRAESLAQWASHLMSLALDSARLAR